jgi:hypothetical protein
MSGVSTDRTHGAARAWPAVHRRLMFKVADLPKDASGAPSLSLARPFTYADAINAGYTRGLTQFGSTRAPHYSS